MELENLSKEEQELALKILQEYSQTGSSKSYKNLLLEDWKEIPVDIGTFLHDEDYLGKGLINGEGKFTLYPYWEELLHKIYPDPFKPATCNTLALTGAIGIGKSTEAVVICLYELYRMMCLRDPYVYYGIMNSDVISFAVINITLDAAQGVAWSKLQNLIQMSPWFCRNGTLSKGDTPVWRPDNGVKIELICGSQPRHFIGRALYFCLDGDTLVATLDGDKKIKDLVDKEINVLSIAADRQLIVSNACTVKPTVKTNLQYEIELEDGTILKCTPEHKFMLKDGTYKEAQFLSKDDELFDMKPFGYIYKMTMLPTGKIYVGKREKSFVDVDYFGSGKKWLTDLKKYGKDNVKVEVLDWAYSRKELKQKEVEWIAKLHAQDDCIGYNIHKGGSGENMLGDTEVWSNLHKGEKNGRYHKPVSQETRKKMSLKNKGRHITNGMQGKHHSEEAEKKISLKNRGHYAGGLNPRAKKVQCIETGEVFDSIVTAKTATGAHQISAVCRGLRETSTGVKLHWRFIKDED